MEILPEKRKFEGNPMFQKGKHWLRPFWNEATFGLRFSRISQQTRVIFDLFAPFKSCMVLVWYGKCFLLIISALAILPPICECILSHFIKCVCRGDEIGFVRGN